MNAEWIEDKKRELSRRMLDLKSQLAVVEAQYNLLLEGEKNMAGGEDRLTITKAALQGMEALGEFNKRQLEAWIRENHPRLDFSFKSLDRTISTAISESKARVLKENVGNKFPTVYKWGAGAPAI